jgi:hypothetical protein
VYGWRSICVTWKVVVGWRGKEQNMAMLGRVVLGELESA